MYEDCISNVVELEDCTKFDLKLVNVNEKKKNSKLSLRIAFDTTNIMFAIVKWENVNFSLILMIRRLE
ncbi:hypothetical protein SNEBB_000244 [Seison nebaliae]|nr:hypothetical protein SNEBB_000244 [Seison nebaliae]